jgi:hypothetical protein
MASSGAVQISTSRPSSAAPVTLEAGKPKIIAFDPASRQTRVLCGAVTYYGDHVSVHGDSVVAYGDVPAHNALVRAPKSKTELHVRTVAPVTIY